MADKLSARRALHSLLLAGHAAGALLLALAPVIVLFLIRIPAGAAPLVADSGMIALWPWWALCTTLLAVRWLYLLPHHQQEVVSVATPVIAVVWGVLLVATVTTGLLAAAWHDAPVSVFAAVWWPLVIGGLIGGSVWWMSGTGKLPAMPTIPPGDLWSIIEKGLSRVDHWVMSFGLQVLPCWRAAGLARVDRLLRGCMWQKALDAGEQLLQRWSIAVTLLLLLGVAMALLST